MKVIDVLRIKKHLALAVASTLTLIGFYAYSQVLFIAENIDLWFAIAPRLNLALFLIFSGLFGVTFSYQIYLWRQPKVCPLKKQSTPGMIGVIVSFFVVQCPACASLGALFLPISVLGVLTVFSIPITLASIALLLVTLFRLGGFRKY